MNELGQTRAEAPEHTGREHPLARHLMVAIVLVTMAIAAVGYLQIRASSRSNDAAQEAERLGSLTMSTLLSSQQNAQVQYELFLQAQDQRGRAGNALQQSLFVRGEAQRAYLTEQRLWQTLAATTQALTPLTQTSRDGPQNDPDFPRHFFSRATLGALEDQASQDIANATNSAWESSAARYTAILTLFAVALFLFGFALALPDRVLRLFGAVGVLLLVVGAAWALQVTLTEPKEISHEAAVEYARGEVALETATDAAGANVAIDHFTKAIDAWPDFSRAYLGRANATLFGSASQVQATLIPPDALERARADLETAQGQGFDNALVLEQLGGAAFSLALHDRPAEFGAAVDDSQRAIAIVPDDPVPRFTLAVSLLGQGDVHGAAEAYARALDAVLYLHAGASQPRNAPAFQQVWISGALSDLEALVAAQPRLADEEGRVKEFLVGSFAADKPVTPGGAASFSGLRVQATPTSVFWIADGHTGFDPSTQHLSTEWYFRQRGSAWVAMPEVSGAVDPSAVASSPAFAGRNLTSSSIPARCLGDEDLRVELYVDGHLAGSAEGSAAFGSLRPFIDRSLNLEVCHPADWSITDSTLPGFRDGLRSSDGSQGVYLFRYNLTTLPQSLQGLAPDDLVDRLLTSTVRSSAALLPAAATQQGAAQHQPFQGLQGSTERVFGYAGGVIEGQAGIDPQDKAVFVTLVFGTQGDFAPGGTLTPVAESIGEYRPGGSSF